MASDAAKGFMQSYNVPRGTFLRLEIYEKLLRKWQKAVNLVGASTLDDTGVAFWRRHMADSAQLLHHAPPNWQKWVDMGTGGGFPGLVIAILRTEKSTNATNSAKIAPEVHLIESDGRKCAFLQTVIRETGVAATVHEGRIEAMRAQKPACFADIDVISARALAPLPDLLALTQPYFAPHTKGLFLKGKTWAAELEKARKWGTFAVDSVPSDTDKDARILICGRPQPRGA